jgi:hypothetical protein
MILMSLYRRRAFQASCALLAILGTVAVAQRHKPHKLRAISLVELTVDTKGVSTARVSPITILDEGRFQDASIYKSTPRPMALDDGIVYEVQKTGQVMGLVTLGRAIKDKDGVWSAPARWQPPSAPKPEARPTPAVAADARPILHRGGKSDSSSSPSTTASPSPTATPSPTASPSATPTPTPAEPIAEDPNRPVLRRGKPAAEPVQAAASQPSAKPVSSPSSAGASVPKLTLSPGAQTLVGISDNESSEPRSYEFVWKKGEQAEMEAKMRRLALAQLPRENPPLSERSLTNVVIRSFDLDLSNDAVMVLTAEIPANTSAAGAKGAAVRSVTRYLTLIARVDFEGTPQRLAVSMTDSSRLDVAPRLELIDAVDADGDGVADLLFRQYSFDSKSYVIFGIGRSTVTKMFEGASSPLK